MEKPWRSAPRDVVAPHRHFVEQVTRTGISSNKWRPGRVLRCSSPGKQQVLMLIPITDPEGIGRRDLDGMVAGD
jgi:hypothetical protein